MLLAADRAACQPEIGGELFSRPTPHERLLRWTTPPAQTI